MPERATDRGEREGGQAGSNKCSKWRHMVHAVSTRDRTNTGIVKDANPRFRDLKASSLLFGGGMTFSHNLRATAVVLG